MAITIRPLGKYDILRDFELVLFVHLLAYFDSRGATWSFGPVN